MFNHNHTTQIGSQYMTTITTTKKNINKNKAINQQNLYDNTSNKEKEKDKQTLSTNYATDKEKKRKEKFKIATQKF